MWIVTSLWIIASWAKGAISMVIFVDRCATPARRYDCHFSISLLFSFEGSARGQNNFVRCRWWGPLGREQEVIQVCFLFALTPDVPTRLSRVACTKNGCFEVTHIPISLSKRWKMLLFLFRLNTTSQSCEDELDFEMFLLCPSI